MKKTKETDGKVKILVIRFRRVGDAVLSTTVLTSLKKSIPNCEIDYVLDAGIAPLFEHHSDIDNIITFSHEEKHSTFKYLRKVKRLMREKRYDIVIDLRSTFNTIPFAIFSKGAKYRIGIDKSYTRPFYNHLIKLDEDKDIIHMLLQRLDPLRGEYDIVKERQFMLQPTQEELDEFKRYMTEKGIDFQKPVVLCAVVTRLEHKMWPLDRMRESLQRILDTYPDAQLIFNYGGGRERELALQLWEQTGRSPRIFIDIEAKGLRQLMAMIALSDFFYGNEGGPRHIAQSLKVPSFAIFPPFTPKGMWLPDENEIYAGVEPCDLQPDIQDGKDKKNEAEYGVVFEVITTDVVWERAKPMLDRYLNNLRK